MAIQQTTVIPEVRNTIVKLRQMSADEKIRMEAFYREKRLHDEATALGSARREGRAEGIAEGIELGAKSYKDSLIEKWRKAGMTDEQIKELLDE